MLNNLKKKLKSLGIGFALSMTKADNDILKGTIEKVPENSSIVSPRYSQNEFLRGIQQGQLKEEQLKRFYQTLDAMDYIHGKNKTKLVQVDDWYEDEETGEMKYGSVNVYIPETMTLDEVIEQEEKKQRLGDYLEGYRIELFLNNKIIFNDSLDKALDRFNVGSGDKPNHIPTLSINRELINYGVPKIEEYTNDIFVKVKEEQDFEEDKSCLVEFYCVNYSITDEDPIIIDLYEKLNEGLNLEYFKDFKSFKILQSTATRNAIPYEFNVDSYYDIKKLDRGLVIRFNCTKI